MSPVRVASLFRTLATGGDERRLLALASALDRSRFEHLVVVAFAPDPARREVDGPMVDEYRRAGIEVVFLHDPVRPPSRLGAVRLGLRLIRRLAALLRRRGIDVLDARLEAAIPLAVAAGRAARTRAIVGTQYSFESWDTPRRRALAEACWPMLDALVCDSRAHLDAMRGFLTRPPRGEVIPNGIAPPESRMTAAEVRRSLGLPESPRVRVVGQVARLMRAKGQGVLLEAARRVFESQEDVVFLLCGFSREPGYREELERQAERLGIADRVRILGWPGSIGDVWQAIDVHVHASLYDSSPIAILEGMAAGRPAVVTSVGGIPELVDDGVTGLVVRPGDAGALAAGLLRVLRTPALAAHLGQAARERYERDHRPEVMARAHEALFEELVASRRAPGAALAGAAP